MAEKTDGELLRLLLELAATATGLARMAVAGSLDLHGYTLKKLIEAESLLRVVSGTKALLKKVEMAPRWREVMVELLEAVEEVGVGR